MTDDNQWAVSAFKDANAGLAETSARQQALEIVIRMLTQGNAYRAQDDLAARGESRFLAAL